MTIQGQNLPIDHFFRSLAEDQGSKAIGVILSGTASDGVLGLKAIKGEGSITFKQDEKSAKYDGVPHSAISAGRVDFSCRRTRLPPNWHTPRPDWVKKGVPADEILTANKEDINKVFLLNNRALAVTVNDLSSGLKPEDRDRVFGPFFTTNTKAWEWVWPSAAPSSKPTAAPCR